MSEEIKGNNNFGDNVEGSVNIVGVHKSKKLFVISVVLILTGIAYYFFFRTEDVPQQSEEPKKMVDHENVEKLLKEAEAPAQETSPRIVTPPPKLPELPPLVLPKVGEFPVLSKIVKKKEKEEPIVTETKEVFSTSSIDHEYQKPVDTADDSGDDYTSSRIPLPYKPASVSPEAPVFMGYSKEKREAPMIALGGGGSEPGSEGDKSGTNVDARFNTQLAKIEGTSSPSVRATAVGDPGYIVLQGYMIDAVLETAINSDIPGVLRAIVSRDVYAAAGNMVMIPKGSRLIGNYFFDSSSSGARVSVNWSRVILPHGVDIQINSGGTDELGRNGISGTVDNKVGAVLTSTILLAGVSAGTAFATSKIPALSSGEVKTKEGDKGDKGDKEKASSTSATLPVKIVSDAVKDFSDSIKSLIQKYSDAKPTIYVDQGTIMKVFVNQDIILPREAVIGGVGVVQ